MSKGLALLVASVAGVALFLITQPPVIESSATSLPLVVEPTTTMSALEPGFSLTGGALPDGTEFLVRVEPAVDDRPVGVSGMIVLDIDGVTNAVGPVQISFNSWWDTRLEDGLYRTSAGGHFVQIEFYDHILEALGPNAEQIIRSSIRGSMGRGYPVLEVDLPFRWATDDELPAQMGVQFRTFEVRRGCSDLAAACSPDRTVQVIPLEALYFPAPPWPDAAEVVVTSG